MNVLFSSALLNNDWLYKIVQGYAQLCELSVRKKAFPLASKLEKLTIKHKKESTKLLFLYGKPAPANFPNAGARIIEASLMTETEWNEYEAAEAALNDREESVEWLDPKPAVTIPANILKKMSQQELESAELFFDVQEGPDESKKDK